MSVCICITIERRSRCGREIKLDRWRSLVNAFEIEHVYIFDRVRTECFYPDLDEGTFTVVETFDEVLADCDFPCVFVEKDAPTNRETTSLTEYEHPEDALYIFGGDACGMPFAFHNQDTDLVGDWVEIPAKGAYGMWAELCAAIVLADRSSSHADH